MTLRTFCAELLDIALPQECLGCGISRTLFCGTCLNSCVITTEQSCVACGKKTPLGAVHPECRSHTPLTGVVVVGEYRRVLKKLVTTYKYHYAQQLNVPLSELLIRAIEQNPFLTMLCMNQEVQMVPVPLHYRKQWERGFNQSALLVEKLTTQYPATYLPNVVKRVAYTKPQAELGREQRLGNLRHVFELIAPERVVGKHILLVDDVITTGATLTQIAQILRSAGAHEIWALAVANG